MRHDVMMEMSLEQLDQYGTACGIDVSGRRTKAQKVALIEERRARVADIDALGMTLHVPVRAMKDKRVTDLLDRDGGLSEAEADWLMGALLGKEQYDALIERCTDDDGVVDVSAVGLAFATIVRSDELKNY